MHSTVQTAVVTIISYKPLPGLNFARYTEQYGSYMPSSPLGLYKEAISPWYGIVPKHSPRPAEALIIVQ